jgi:hypothetical protein
LLKQLTTPDSKPANNTNYLPFIFTKMHYSLLLTPAFITLALGVAIPHGDHTIEERNAKANDVLVGYRPGLGGDIVARDAKSSDVLVGYRVSIA